MNLGLGLGFRVYGLGFRHWDAVCSPKQQCSKGCGNAMGVER